MAKLNIAIIGFGRFGSLLADLLKIVGQIHIIETKIIKTEYKQISTKELKQMDWVIIAVPIRRIEVVANKIKNNLKPSAIVMDVASVKEMPCNWMKKNLPANVQILGTHPMFGPDSAKYGLKGLSMVFCPISIKHSKLNEIISIFKKMQLNTVVMTPAAHDKEAAMSLAMVHYLGRALGAMKIMPQQVSTLGFERLLAVNETVENDSKELFIDMHKYNRYSQKYRKLLLNKLKKLDFELQK